MIASAHLRRQHQDVQDIVTEIAAQLETETLATRAVEVRKLLSTFFGKLRIHLSMEDDALYPRLLTHSDAEIHRVVQRFQSEMGGIAEEVERYRTKWTTASSIQQSPQEFICETNALFSALRKRIDKENQELYPLFDRQESNTTRMHIVNAKHSAPDSLAHPGKARTIYNTKHAVAVHLTLDAGELLMPQIAPVDMFFYILEGTPTIEVGEERQPVGADHVVDIPVSSRYGLTNETTQIARILVVKAPKPFTQS